MENQEQNTVDNSAQDFQPVYEKENGPMGTNTPPPAPASAPAPQEKVSEKKHGLMYTLIIVAVIIAGALFWYWNTEKVYGISDGVSIRTPRGDKVVSTFPEELFLENSIKVNKSYALEYTEDSIQQPVLSYVSGMSLQDNIIVFGEYLESNDWSITKRAGYDTPPITSFYANRGDEEVNIIFEEDGLSVISVTIAYVLKNVEIK